MWINHLHIKRFRSLRNVEMKDIGNLVILIGSNSSGKTNLLEALTFFFSELTPELERNLGGISDYSWFDRDPSHSIEFDVTLTLDSSDALAIFPEDVRGALKIVDKAQIRFVRAISGSPGSATWKMNRVEVNGLLVTPPQPQQTTAAAAALSVDQIGKVLQSLSQRLRSRFSFVPSARDMMGNYTALQQRNPIMRPEDLNDWRTLGQSTGRDEMRKFTKLENLVKEASPYVEDIRILGGELTIREQGREFPTPINWVGGGHQALFAILNRLSKEQGKIIAVDEPEQHLHPSLARRLFDTLGGLSNNQHEVDPGFRTGG